MGTDAGWIIAGQRADQAEPLWAALRSAMTPPGDGPADTEARTAGHIAADEAAIERAVDAAARDGATRVVIVPMAVMVEDRSAGTGPDIEPALDRLRAKYPNLEIGSIGVRADDATAARLIELLRADQPSPADMVDAALARVFGGRAEVLAGFLAALYGGLPDGTALCLRGSAVNGTSYETGAPFDARGPGSSDLDIVAIGEDAAACWVDDARLLGGVNSLPLCDGSEWVAPALDPARRRAQAIVERPVSLQSMARWFLDLRAAVQGQRYIDLGPPAA